MKKVVALGTHIGALPRPRATPRADVPSCGACARSPARDNRVLMGMTRWSGRAGLTMQAADINSAEPVSESNGTPPRAAGWYRRVGFWRALAGMALALALACAIVALETSSELTHRSASYHRRLVQLVARIKQMRGEMATADRRIAGMRNEAAVRERLGHILAAPDTRLIRLGAPRASGPSGLVAI